MTDMETIKAVEVPHLADMLSRSIANLGYPVGLGIPPSEDHANKAAAALFDRFVGIAKAIQSDEIERLRAELAAQTERADFAWQNTNIIERARQEEMAKRDKAEAELAAIKGQE